MRKNKGKRAAGGKALDLAHGGQDIPPTVLRRAIADANGRMEGFAKEKIRLYREAEKYRSKLRKPIDRKDPEVTRAMNELRGIGNGIAKRKVIAPAVARQIPGIAAGSYSLRLTPGYDYGHFDSFPDTPPNSAFVHRGTGELGFTTRAVRKGDDAFASVSMGAFFIPIFGPAHLRASVDPALSFAWWTISTGITAVTFALMDFRISAYRRDGTFDSSVRPTGSGAKTVWFKQTGLDLDFDYGSISSNPMTAAVDVDTNHFYLISLECLGQAFSSAGTAAPGFISVAGGILDVTLPYIDLDLKFVPVLSQAL